MKKLALIALTLATASSFAWEVNFKGGYDFARINTATQIGENAENIPSALSNGWVVGGEIIPLDKSRVQLGAGTEFNFGSNSIDFLGVDNVFKKDSTSYKYQIIAPLYALVRVNLIQSEDNSGALYAFGRLGYAFNNHYKDAYTLPKDAKEKRLEEKASDVIKAGGLYYGAGLGYSFGNFLVEGLYDGTYKKATIGEAADAKTYNVFNNKFGIRLGLRFGDFLTPVEKAAPAPTPAPAPEPEKTPEPAPAPVVVEPVVVEQPVVVETPAPAPTPTPEPKRLMSGLCDEATNTCVLHGFAINVATPDKETQDAMKTLVKTLEDYTDGANLDIVGYTSNTGTKAYNQKLSVRRANSVAKLLREFGLKDSFKYDKVYGLGLTHPMASNKTKEGRALNRRVELILKNVK